MKNIWLILIISVLVKVCLSYATFHPDIAALSDSGKFISAGHLLDFYNFSSEKLVLNYPPVTYWYFGIFDFLFNANIPLLKLSYLFFDIGLGFILYKLVDPKKSILIFSLWMFNPINLYATYMMGQFDIIPTFFTVLSIYLVAKSRINWAALALGMGVAFKLYPLFLLVPLVFLVKNNWDKLKLTILSLMPYFISILPYLSSRNFRANALFASQSSKSLYASIPVSGGESIFLFPVVLLFFYYLIWQKKLFTLLWKKYLIILLLFFIFTHYHPQWLIWTTPFIVLDLTKNKFKNLLPVIVILISWTASLFFFDPSLSVGIFSPIFPILKNNPDIWTILHLKPDYNFSRSLLQTVFVSSAFYLIYRFFQKEEDA